MPDATIRSTVDIETPEKGTGVYWDRLIRARLYPGEKALQVLEDLVCRFAYVPHYVPSSTWSWGGGGILCPAALVLTADRFLVGFEVPAADAWQRSLRWYCVAGILAIEESGQTQGKSGLLSSQPPTPYAATLWLPGGIMLRVACPKPDLQYAKQLQSLLDRAFLLLGRKTIDDALPAIMAFEEQKRQEEERKRRED